MFAMFAMFAEIIWRQRQVTTSTTSNKKHKATILVYPLFSIEREAKYGHVNYVQPLTIQRYLYFSPERRGGTASLSRAVPEQPRPGARDQGQEKEGHVAHHAD